MNRHWCVGQHRNSCARQSGWDVPMGRRKKWWKVPGRQQTANQQGGGGGGKDKTRWRAPRRSETGRPSRKGHTHDVYDGVVIGFFSPASRSGERSRTIRNSNSVFVFLVSDPIRDTPQYTLIVIIVIIILLITRNL